MNPSGWGNRRPGSAICLSLVLALTAFLVPSASAAIVIDEGATTVKTSKLELDFGDGGGTVEWLKDLKWRNSAETPGADLTAESGVAGGVCGGAPGEFWGQSYGNEDSHGPLPVFTGAHGTWGARGGRSIELNSVLSTTCSGDTPGIPVRTRYTFFDTGTAANMVRVDRRWSFAFDQVSSNPAQGMRTYVPRLSYGTYNQEIYPKGDETGLSTDGVGEVLRTGAAWNQKWYAINAAAPAAPPILNSGVLFLRDPASVNTVTNPASLKIDYDSSSGANNSGVSLDRPLPSGWLAPRSETFYVCFYDEASWPLAERTVTRLPDGCEPRTPPINLIAPALTAGAGSPRAGDTYAATPGAWEFSTGSFTYQWSRCQEAGEDFTCSPIGGATGTSYTATSADVGKSLRVSVTTSSSSGETETAESNVAGFLSGHVYIGEEGSGKEAAGAPVQVCKRSGSPCRSTTTDGAGFYRVQVPVSGKYRVTAFPPAGSNAASRTLETITRVWPEEETSGVNVILPLPQAPPPQVEFSGSGVRGKPSSGVPVVHWQEPFVIEYERDKDAEVEVKIELGNGEIVRIPPQLPPEPAEDPENAIFKFPVEPLYPNHGNANVTVVVREPESPAEEQEAKEAKEKEQKEEEKREKQKEKEDTDEDNEGTPPPPDPDPDDPPPSEDKTPEEKEKEKEREKKEREKEKEKEDDEDTFPIYIDPSGFVRTTDGAPLGDATVTLYRSDSREGPFTVVPDGSAVMSPMNRVNPDQSEASGHFGWDVIAGFYKVRAEKQGCNAPGDAGQPFVETPVQDIPPPVTDLDIRLECVARPGIRLRPNLKLPRKGGKVKVKKSGAYALKGATVSCPAESTGACTVTLTALKKKKKLGTTKLSVKAGKTAKLAGKLSKKGLKQLKPKGTKGSFSILATVPGGDSASGSVAATLVPTKKKPRRRR